MSLATTRNIPINYLTFHWKKKSKDFLFVRIKHVHPSVLLQQSGAIREDLKKYGIFLFPFLKVFIVSA